MKAARRTPWQEELPEAREARRALRPVFRATWAAILAENALRAFWPLLTVAAFAGAVLLSGLTALLPFEVAAVLAAVFGGLALAGLAYALRRFRWPDEGAVITRLDDNLPGRPLVALSDRQALGREDAGATYLWAAHIRQIAERARSASAVRPDLDLSRRDPYGLRLAALAALGAALIFAPDGGFVPPAGPPGPRAAALPSGPVWEAWANPPTYTGKPGFYLSAENDPEVFDLPVGTVVTVRLYGADDPAAFRETVSARGDGNLRTTAEGIADTAVTIARSGELALDLAGGKGFAWSVTAIPDSPPSIRLTGPVKRATSGAAEIGFALRDDYGVAEAWAEITLYLNAVARSHGLAADPLPREALTLTLPLPRTEPGAEAEDRAVEDFSEHPWAGLPVRVTLFARDGAGQLGEAAGLAEALPARRFFDPLAAAIIEQRRDILWSPDNASRVGRVLRAISWKPEDIFENDGAYLLLRAAIRRLDFNRADGLTPGETDEVAAMLWAAAIKIEDGDLADAAERLRRAEDRLAQALRDGASEEEIEELTRELAEAMQDYMQQLAREALENGETQSAENQPGQEITPDQLQDLLDRIEELAREGRMAEAEELLEQLRQMMENMQMALRQQQGSGGEGQGQGAQMLQDLQDMLGQQQGLADDSFRSLQDQFRNNRGAANGQGGQGEGQEGGRQGGDQTGPRGMTPGELADRQEALRQLLDELRQGLPGPGSEAGEAAREALREAERNMGEARDSLDAEDFGGALDRQADAMENLRQGMRGLAEDLQRQARAQGRQPGEGVEGGEAGDDSRDPLGRPLGANGSIFTNDDLLPGADALRRAREILEEIRRRAGEQGRPEAERDYLKRLLERF